MSPPIYTRRVKAMKRNKIIIEREKEKGEKTHGWKVKKDKNFQSTFLLSQMLYPFKQISILHSYVELQKQKQIYI